MATDPEPDETRLLRAHNRIGAVQRWDRPDGLTFRLDLWPVDDDERDDDETEGPDPDAEQTL